MNNLPEHSIREYGGNLLQMTDLPRYDQEACGNMKLYLVHCGYYDSEICEGLYEGHVNFFVAAESFDQARAKAKAIPEFIKKKMHVDGLQEIVAINGYQIKLELREEAREESIIRVQRHRDLAPKGAS